jgi:hypothetical protein
MLFIKKLFLSRWSKLTFSLVDFLSIKAAKLGLWTEEGARVLWESIPRVA